MRGLFFLTAAAAVLLEANAAPGLVAGEPDRTGKVRQLDSVVVSASRAGAYTPVTYTMVGRDALRAADPAQSLPMNLNLQPSVVTYNEGGTGLGNSAMTVRGSKGSQINVTLNGITLNDAESQEVFWVNIPALTRLISSVQLQRGLGTSANGAGSFGASVNMSTASVSPQPFADVELGGGSWATFLGSAAFGTGLTPSGLYFNMAYTKGRTDGYIRNGFVRTQSAFAVLGWLHGNNSLRLTWLMGDQRSGITWDGISPEQYATDRRQNTSGMWTDDEGIIHFYDNQTDNYRQHHLQLNWSRQWTDALSWSNTLNYTRGDGYDEYYKTDRKLAAFGLPVSPQDPDAVTVSDMIYRKCMGNDLLVFKSDLKYQSRELELTAGVHLSRYWGQHWGKLLWVKEWGDDADLSPYNDRYAWYRNTGNKDDGSAFVRGEYRIFPWAVVYGDLQYRRIGYVLDGYDDDHLSKWDGRMDYRKTWEFLNPRAGVTFDWHPAHRAYLSAAVGHREPGRSDIKDNIKGAPEPIRPERMLDFEAGYAYTGPAFSASVNLYAMEYKDMLLETGRLSSSGYAIKENVSRGWRRGMELQAAWQPGKALRLDANATFSVNRLADFTAYYEDWESGGYKVVPCGRTTMLMSPSAVGMVRATIRPLVTARGPFSRLAWVWDGKYVGSQYWDNTESPDRCIPAYFVVHTGLNCPLRVGKGTLTLSGDVNNLLNRDYYAYAWVYRAWQGGDDPWYQEAGLYPQAPVNFMLRLRYSF